MLVITQLNKSKQFPSTSTPRHSNCEVIVQSSLSINRKTASCDIVECKWGTVLRECVNQRDVWWYRAVNNTHNATSSAWRTCKFQWHQWWRKRILHENHEISHSISFRLRDNNKISPLARLPIQQSGTVFSPRLCSSAILLISSFSGDIPTVIAFATVRKINTKIVRCTSPVYSSCELIKELHVTI